MITNVDQFEKGEEIGGGSFSVGNLRGEPVAIKIARDEGRKSIHKELQIYDKVKHPNILPALGVHLGVDNMLFLTLRNFNLKDYFIDYGNKLDIRQLKQYCIQVADAMKYLHHKNILHCDLKIDNILVKDEDGEEIEISDFGCAIDLDLDHCNKFIGTQTHTAYEILKYRQNQYILTAASKASDVWSFAVTAWQILQKSDQLPSDFIKPEDIVKNYEAGKKLPIPAIVAEDFWRYIILPCFDLHPKARPTMEDLHKSLIKFGNDFVFSEK
uniref:Protein kinase domain-containing protein n=1 Tax=Panagrolaimus sp. PS1159 TaxID=55785 RepID=A0AC35ETF6_9BILA